LPDQPPATANSQQPTPSAKAAAAPAVVTD
jgi:hypothetical protein